MNEIIKWLLVYSIFLLFVIIGFFFIIILIRRFFRVKRFIKLDQLRELYRKKFNEALNFEDFDISIFQYSEGSLKWQAVEDVLFEHMDGDHTEKITEFFKKLRYIDFYEKKLQSKSKTTKCAAIDKLGRMRSTMSVQKLIEMFKYKDPEITSTILIALSRIKTIEALKGLLDNLVYIYEHWLVTRKTIVTAISNFDINFLPLVMEYAEKNFNNPKILTVILNAISNFKDSNLIKFVVNLISCEAAEVKAKALKIVEKNAEYLEKEDIDKIMKLKNDPSWFVRLRLVKALEYIRDERVLFTLESLLFDANWQVRDAAARTLSKFGNSAIDVIINVLESSDIYAKENLCEALQKNFFISRLFDNLKSCDKEIKEKSDRILRILESFNLCPINDNN